MGMESEGTRQPTKAVPLTSVWQEEDARKAIPVKMGPEKLQHGFNLAFSVVTNAQLQEQFDTLFQFAPVSAFSWGFALVSW